MKKLALLVSLALCGLFTPQFPSFAHSRVQGVQIGSETVSGSWKYNTPEGPYTWSIVAPAKVQCHVTNETHFSDTQYGAWSTCTFEYSTVVDQPGVAEQQFVDRIKIFAGQSVTEAVAPVSSEPVTRTADVTIGFAKNQIATIAFKGVLLEISLTVTQSKSLKKLSSKTFKKPCSKPQLYQLAAYGMSFASCEKIGKTYKWMLPTQKPITQLALEACAIDERFARIGDSGKTLILNQFFLSVPKGTWMCVAKALNMPDSVQSQVGQTRSVDGRQVANWGKLSANWSYHPDQGMNMIVSVR